MSGFDMAPPTTAMLPGATAAAGQVPGTKTNPAIPGMFPNMFPLASGQFGALPVMPVQAMTQQSVATFFSHVMSAIGGNTAGPGDAVVNVYINYEKKFAFIEMRSAEEASNAMASNLRYLNGAPCKVRKPSDYYPSLAATLGPSQPNPNLNLAAVGLSPGSAGGLDGPDRIFVGEAQIRELLESFGPLRGFDLVKDRETGNSKHSIPSPNGEPTPGVGKVFLEYGDVDSASKARQSLNGRKFGGNQVVAVFYPENKFYEGDYDG
ncbi:hypothetical protein RND71_019505 [Anisodus tanguticus]|uniref:RRM domain-containing protein n=1 Tax=Anisodus tanguticus TaxID=243964 RepID=A0AAE1RZ46_9SOLA|nr:hypothetical protein RND71_019505 [Anisodus tanguticus]